MPKVVIFAVDGSIEREAHVDKTIFSIGRHRSCDVQILDASVSGLHAEIQFDSDGIRINDRGSTNGTEVDGTRIEEARLEDGQRIRLGTRQIALFREIDAPTRPRVPKEGDSLRTTQVVDRVLGETRLVLVSTPNAATIGDDAPVRKDILLSHTPLLLGSGHHCKVRLPSDNVGLEHARLSVKESQFHVRSLDSDHPVLVNDQPLQEATLQTGDRLQLGEFIFRVEPGAYFGTSSELSRAEEETTLVVPPSLPEDSTVTLVPGTRMAIPPRPASGAVALRWGMVGLAAAVVAVLVFLVVNR